MELKKLKTMEQHTKTWKVDKAHSSVKFTVTHLIISEVEGSFKDYDGTFSTSKDDFSNAAIHFSVDVDSISTDNTMRDGHLKSDDFFNAAAFPKMLFESTSFKKLSDSQYELIGNLTIRDFTKSVTFNVKHGGVGKDGYGNTKAGFKASSKINRFDYGLKWNALTEVGGVTVGAEVEIALNLQFTLTK